MPVFDTLADLEKEQQEKVEQAPAKEKPAVPQRPPRTSSKKDVFETSAAPSLPQSPPPLPPRRIAKVTQEYDYHLFRLVAASEFPNSRFFFFFSFQNPVL